MHLEKYYNHHTFPGTSMPLTGVLLADARPQGSAQGGAQASPRPRARARGHQGPQAEPQGDAQLPQGGVRGPHQVQLLNMLHRSTYTIFDEGALLLHLQMGLFCQHRI